MARFGSFDRVSHALRSGRAAVFPTDTVYGIGVAVGRAESPREIYTVKRRDIDKAIPWLVDGVTALDVFGRDVPDYARVLAREFWPGPLTMIVDANGGVPRPFGTEGRTVALRMPDDKTALDLIARAGCPIATSSANFQGRVPPRSFCDIDQGFLAQVVAYCGDDVPRSGTASTIVDCTGGTLRLVREGEITNGDIRRALG